MMTSRFRLKFKSFVEQYELRELHFQSLMKTKECEVHFNIARYEHQRKLAENESTRSRTLTAQVNTFSQTETELRSQLNIYVEKFKQVSGDLQHYTRCLFLSCQTNVREVIVTSASMLLLSSDFKNFPYSRSKIRSTTRTTYS